MTKAALLIGGMITLIVGFAAGYTAAVTREHCLERDQLQADLAWLIGSWRVEKRYYPNPFMHGRNLVETEQCAWAVGGHYVVCNSEDILDNHKPVRETVAWSQDAERHVVRFIDISPDDPTDLPTAGRCRIEGDMWYCSSEPRLEDGKNIYLRFVQKNTPSSAKGNSLFSEDGTKWSPLSDDSFTKVR
jgi:hypothetical protein